MSLCPVIWELECRCGKGRIDKQDGDYIMNEHEEQAERRIALHELFQVMENGKHSNWLDM